MEWLQSNAWWLIIVVPVLFSALERYVRKSKAKWDDVLFDMILLPLWDKLKELVGKNKTSRAKYVDKKSKPDMKDIG